MIKTFKQYIAEGKMIDKKGWINKSGKMLIENTVMMYHPFHIQMLAKNPEDFGESDEKLREIIADDWGLDPESIDVYHHYEELEEGIVDKNKAIEEYMFKKGWAEVVFSEGANSIDMGLKSKLSDIRKIAKIIDKKFSEKELYPEPSSWFEVTEGTKRHDIGSLMDWKAFIKTGRIPKRSEIGATMAMFRECLEEQKRFTPTMSIIFPSAVQAAVFVKDIRKERGNVQVQYTYEKGYRKNLVDVKWSGSHERTVRDLMRKHNGIPAVR